LFKGQTRELLCGELDESTYVSRQHEDMLIPGMEKAMVSVSAPPDRPPLSPATEPQREPNAVLTEAADEAEMPLPSNPQTFFLGGIFALGIFAALYEASWIILPVVLAFVFLQPAVRLLGHLHLPRALGALFTVLLAIGVLVGLIAALSVPAAIWAKRLPEGIPRLEAHLVVLQNPIRALQTVLQQAEEVADTPGRKAAIMPADTISA
jgi:hypothetical protein